jgi:predicted RNase H-like nuclease (RuvC/YqgF family)
VRSLKELEVEAYLAGALVTADLYARTEDALEFEFKLVRLEEERLDLQDQNDDLRRLSEDYEQYLSDYEKDVTKLKARVEELEFAAWRLEELEK